MCPKGDDPMTVNSNYKTIELLVSVPKHIPFTGLLGIRFQGEITYIPVEKFSSELCEQKFENSAKFRDITCIYSIPYPHQHKFHITFLKWPITPQENNLHLNDGNPPISDFSCDFSQLSSSSISCTFTDLINTDVPGIYYLFTFIY